MYDHILGEVIETTPARVVLRAGGIGFLLETPAGTSARLQVGETARLFTIHHVVDGVPSLLGFDDRTERELARRLLSVSGVGKAMTLAVLSCYSPRELAGAILGGDHAALRRIKGVGAKTAERLCLELRDHVQKLELTPDGGADLMPRPSEDAIAALSALGYSEKEARSKVRRAREKRPQASTDELVRAVLRG